MSDHIGITGLEVTTCHGVLPEEKTSPQRFLADIDLELDLQPAGATDDLQRSVSYAEIAQAAEAILRGAPVDLIENLAERIATMCLQRREVEAATVTIRKPQAPAGVPFHDAALGGPSVTVHRAQDRPVVIAAGANLGDRQATIEAAVRLLGQVDGLTIIGVAPFVETDPVGGPEQPDYLNTVLVGRTRLAPWTLLRHLHRIESYFRREREIRWGARTLDLDLIQLGDPAEGTEWTVDGDLQLPHPRATERAFVLQPWSRVDPGAHASDVDGQVRPVVGILEQLGTDGVREARR
ncbi:2-amino-4-hydroxy-6-hydroxymethyldihydropteridine diphosphokinase [Calidifontibacter sp. DB0510]|uniref:Bifunctional folate synthesis protein n=1 Tax=Metallococcus carri TaxID=1656884 RepID=A0A967AYH4_9MICO|nr:2-amino-4-hydroxy-6-hydroxymethyldihydropteridine diphosphokinase [Metallococcus carri]NHN55364.1 2-amino-4-hydroxy-6-hydroxymethyldihydropteridine diphosphokinase [Metallococcus carri]NOP36441.1 2-amino-4-hydroxy-6-hydroxymethyldihydropteridine diphosphokinase [Calidifontibacter sp. DB2511S]